MGLVYSQSSVKVLRIYQFKIWTINQAKIIESNCTWAILRFDMDAHCVRSAGVRAEDREACWMTGVGSPTVRAQVINDLSLAINCLGRRHLTAGY